MASNRFYLACYRDNVGTNVAFHAKEGRGYTTDLDKAEVFTREEAQRRWNHGREFDQPLCADRVDQRAVWHVDCQRIPHVNTISENEHLYVAFRRQCWDGNDVYWIQQYGEPTTDFTKAMVSSEMAVDNNVWIPFDLADKAKRRTISKYQINHRKMVQAAGLKTPDHIKRYRRRKGSSGKVRMNCPDCGRIHWQYNPYDFDGCRNINCESFRF